MTQPYQAPQPPQPYQPPQPPAAPAAKKPRRWLGIVIPITTFILGIIIGSSTNSSTSATTSAPATQPTPASQAPAQNAQPATQQPAPQQAPAKPAGPKTDFGDGTYLVGTDIAAGSYKTTGPRPGGLSLCYWARLKDDSGNDIIANDNSQGPTRFTAKTGEYVQVTGCDFTKA